jgi:hypothetical protein
VVGIDKCACDDQLPNRRRYFPYQIMEGLPVIQAQSRKAAANRLRTMSFLGVPDFKAEWFRATPMAPYTHFHEFAFVRRSTYTQRHAIHSTCRLPCNFLPFASC